MRVPWRMPDGSPAGRLWGTVSLLEGYMYLRHLARAAVLAASLAAATLPLLASAPDADAATTNLIKNPGCESSTAGWLAYQGTLARDTNAHHSGVASCRVTYTSGGYATLDDSPATVANPP